MFDLSKRVAVVTGSSSGIGVQFAQALARQGASVALLARRLDKLEAVAAEIRKAGGKALPVVCDVTNSSQVKDAVAAVVKEYGKVDILVNNAGSNILGLTENRSDEDWAKMLDLNLTSLFYCAREFGKEMIKNKHGRIINIASAYGVTVSPGEVPGISYTTTKGAVVHMTRHLGAEWAHYGITVNAICPGWFESELTDMLFKTPEGRAFVTANNPMGRAGRKGEMDSLVVFLAADESSYINCTINLADGGLAVVM